MKILGDFVNLWTIQMPQAVRNLYIDGVLVGDWDRVESHFHRAYLWMIDRMEQRLGIDMFYNPPMWAWAGRPDLRRSCRGRPGSDQILIGFRAPTSQVLFSDFEDFHFVLNDWHLPPEDSLDDESWDESQDSVDKEGSWKRIFVIAEGERSQACLRQIELPWVKSTFAFKAR